MSRIQKVITIVFVSISGIFYSFTSAFAVSDPRCDADGSAGIDTAVGCIPVDDTQTFAEFLLRWGMGIGGGLALILIGYGGFMVVTSDGNPQKVQAGKELITAALAGLLFIVFSAFILRLVGIDILGIAQLGV